MGVLLLVEHSDGRPDRLSLEALAMARKLVAEWGPLHAVLFEAGAGEGGAGGGGGAWAADGAAEAAAVLGALGVPSASLVAHEALTDYAPAAWGAALAQLARERGDRAVVAAGSDRGNEVLAHVAARADLPMVANCTELRPGDPLGITRQRWAGGLLEDCLLDAPVAVLSVAPHAVEPADLGAGGGADAGGPAVSTFEPALADADLVARVVRREAPEAGRLSLADARVVVGGGRGVGGAEGFRALEELAGLLGGTVGVSRAVTSAGWRPHSEQVGQTGVRIAPDVYIACGISGAIQHIVGCKAARQIIVINSDPEAPILERASHAVVGDLRTIVPAISAEIRRARSG